MEENLNLMEERGGLSPAPSTHDTPDQNRVEQTAESCRKASADTTVDTTGQTGQTPCLQSRCNDENTGSTNLTDRTEAHDGAQPKYAEETQGIKRLEPGHRQLLVKSGLPLTAKCLFGPWSFAWTDSKYIYGDAEAFYIYNHYADQGTTMSEISKPIPRSSDAGQAIRALLEASKGKEWAAEVSDNG